MAQSTHDFNHALIPPPFRWLKTQLTEMLYLAEIFFESPVDESLSWILSQLAFTGAVGASVRTTTICVYSLLWSVLSWHGSPIEIQEVIGKLRPDAKTETRIYDLRSMSQCSVRCGKKSKAEGSSMEEAASTLEITANIIMNEWRSWSTYDIVRSYIRSIARHHDNFSSFAISTLCLLIASTKFNVGITSSYVHKLQWW